MTTAFTSTIARAVLGTVGTAVCAGLCLVAATAPANAAVSASASGLRTTTVSYADLDLRSAPGRATLNHRIANAARAVCVSANTGPMARVEEGRCVRQAVTAARSIS